MKIGKRIRYGSSNYTVELSELEENGWGRVDYTDRKVMLDNNIPDDLLKAVLLHEVLHIIGEHTGQKLKEGIVDAISYNLIQVIKDNPWLKGLFE